MASSDKLRNAKDAKNDEFYTRLEDIELELKNYKKEFKDKIVFCNCDDPFESNFVKYFAMNFNALGLKKLIATCYSGSQITGEQLSLFDLNYNIGIKKKNPAYKIEITEVKDLNGDGAIDLVDVKDLLIHDKNTLTLLKGNGDFRSDECIKLLKECDIVVTNPPFSLWREYVAQLFEYKKKFLIIGNINNVNYKEVFPYIKNNEMWLGQSIHSGDRKFLVPKRVFDSEKVKGKVEEDSQGNKYVHVVGVRWFTNLDYVERHEKVILYKKYNPSEYPKYDNFNAINVDKISEIPKDYEGMMGVPVSLLDKYNPEQFELIGIGTGDSAKQIGVTKNYRGRTDLAYTINGINKCPFNRIIIKNINPEKSEGDFCEN